MELENVYSEDVPIILKSQKIYPKNKLQNAKPINNLKLSNTKPLNTV